MTLSISELLFPEDKHKFNTIYDLYELVIDLVKPNFDEGPYIAGSFPMRLYCKMPVDHHDIDIFTTSERQFVKLCDILKKNLPNAFPFVSGNATSFKIASEDGKNAGIVQLIKPNRGQNLCRILDTFDIRACRFATDGKTFKFDREALNDAQKKLANFVHYNENTLKRVIKYTAYGFTVDQATVQYVADNLSTFDVSNSDGY